MRRTENEKIEHIWLELTNRCNLKCKICNIWKERVKKKLNIKDITKITKLIRTPFSVSIGGGEPFLNPQINNIYRHLFKLYLKGRVTRINISTNAYLTKTVEFLAKNKKYLLPLSFTVSLDGLNKLHCLQRGKKNSFNKTLNNIFKIKKYKVPLSIKFVVTSLNYKDLFKVYLLAKEAKCNFRIKLFEKVNSYYHRSDQINRKLMLSKKQKEIVGQSINKIYLLEKNKNNNYLKFILLSLKKALKDHQLNFIKKCQIPSKTLFVTAYKKIYNCLYFPPVGKIFKDSIEIDWNQFKMIKNKTSDGKCPKCMAYHGYLKGFNS